MVTATRGPRSDGLPENGNWKDTGCDYAPSCLSCPFKTCRYDTTDGIRGLLNAPRDRAVLQDSRAGLNRYQLAAKYDLSVRSIQRILTNGTV